MKHKRQSLAALRRLAREAADAFDDYAFEMWRGQPIPTVSVTVSTPVFYLGELLRVHKRQASAIRIPGTPWIVWPTRNACREAAALLRRNPDSIGKTMTVRAPVSVEDTVKDARRLYGDDAAAVLCRQLETIDPDDYHAPAVKRWNAALRQIVREDAEKHEATTT